MHKTGLVKITSGLLLVVIMGAVLFVWQKMPAEAAERTLWSIQSVDTMKFSRDIARQELSDPSFDAVIEAQTRAIADTGATHIAIGTPYDEEFVPFLQRWVTAARRHGLSVWFRGNFSGWEGWFGYERISRGEHLVMTEEFILNNPSLFADGDIFDACPECENGGPGDPRWTGDVGGFRQFLQDQYWVSRHAFERIGKAVRSNFFSMNGDVARLVMDKDTTAALDGVVVIDHYVSTAEKLARDIRDLARRSGGRIVLGEFGAPIPDLHGRLNPDEQAEWIMEALDLLAKIPELTGVNYWISVGGSTAIWSQQLVARPAVKVLSDFFKPIEVTGLVTDPAKKPLPEASVRTEYQETTTNEKGEFVVYFPREHTSELLVSAPGYAEKSLAIERFDRQQHVVLKVPERGFFLRAWDWLYQVWQRLLDSWSN